MALTYEWKLRSLKKANTSDYNNIVVQAHWDCTGTDEDGDFGTFGGSTSFDAFDIDSNNFITYEELTEADVLNWVQAIFVGNYKEHVDAIILKQIDDKKISVVEVAESQFPWSTSPTTPE